MHLGGRSGSPALGSDCVKHSESVGRVRRAVWARVVAEAGRKAPAPDQEVSSPQSTNSAPLCGLAELNGAPPWQLSRAGPTVGVPPVRPRCRGCWAQPGAAIVAATPAVTDESTRAVEVMRLPTTLRAIVITVLPVLRIPVREPCEQSSNSVASTISSRSAKPVDPWRASRFNSAS